MSNACVPAAAEGLPAVPVLPAMLAAPASLDACPHAALLASIPTWMELRIEAHRGALRALRNAARELAVFGGSAGIRARQNPSALALEIEQAHDLATDRERDALALLLAERPRSDRDAAARLAYLAGFSSAAVAPDCFTLGGEG